MTQLDRRPPRRRGVHASLLAAALPAALAVAFAPAARAADLEAGEPAPRLTLRSLDGRMIDTGHADGRALLLLFVETDHEKSAAAVAEVTAALDTPRLAGQPIDWVLVLSKSSDPAALWPEVTDARRPPVVVHDTQRTAFGACRVLVVPTAVVVDREGRVVHSMAGHTGRFADIVYDALSLAVGKITADRFQRTLHPAVAPSPDEARRQAERLTLLAVELVQRGLDELAEAKYREAVELDPQLVRAGLGLGELLLRQGRLDEAEARFEKVLAIRPESPEARLGLGRIAVRRGDDLDGAEAVARELLAEGPRARAYYLLGMVQERRGELAEAAASFRRAAELLLRRAAPSDALPEPEPSS